MPDPIQILIVDDHQLFLQGLEAILADVPSLEVVQMVTTGGAALQAIKHGSFDVVLLDINLPDISGLKVASQIRELPHAPHVIALTMQHESSLLKGMLKAGAKGYLLKNTHKQELVEAIEQVHQGGEYLSPEVTQSLVQAMMGKKWPGTSVPRLSRREKEVLALILEEYTTQEIADQLSISGNTVENHRRNLLAKLEVRNTAGLVRKALEFNLLES